MPLLDSVTAGYPGNTTAEINDLASTADTKTQAALDAFQAIANNATASAGQIAAAAAQLQINLAAATAILKQAGKPAEQIEQIVQSLR